MKAKISKGFRFEEYVSKRPLDGVLPPGGWSNAEKYKQSWMNAEIYKDRNVYRVLNIKTRNDVKLASIIEGNLVSIGGFEDLLEIGKQYIVGRGLEKTLSPEGETYQKEIYCISIEPNGSISKDPVRGIFDNNKNLGYNSKEDINKISRVHFHIADLRYTTCITRLGLNPLVIEEWKEVNKELLKVNEIEL